MWVFCAIPAGARPAEAEPESKTYALHFNGSPRCNDPGKFLATVRQHVPSARQDPEGRVRVTIQLEDLAAVSRGKLRIGEADERHVMLGASCAEVLEAMAMMLVMVLDPHARKDSPVPEERNTTTEPAQPPSTGKEERAPREPRPERPVASKSERPSEWRFRPGIVAGGEMRTGASPVLLFAGRAGFEARIERVGPFWPSIRAEGSYGRGPVSTNSGAPWDFSLILLRLQVCPVHYTPSASLRWHACVQAERGELSASEKLAELEGGSKPELSWLAAGASIALELPLVHWLSVEIGANSMALLETGRFVESAKREHLLNETPPVVVGLSLGLLAWLE